MCTHAHVHTCTTRTHTCTAQARIRSHMYAHGHAHRTHAHSPPRHSRDRVEGPLAAVGLGLLDVDGLVEGLQLWGDTHQGTSGHGSPRRPPAPHQIWGHPEGTTSAHACTPTHTFTAPSLLHKHTLTLPLPGLPTPKPRLRPHSGQTLAERDGGGGSTRSPGQHYRADDQGPEAQGCPQE